MNDLHQRIINIPIPYDDAPFEYREGHRDARHAAAEIAAEGDARIEALETEVERLEAQNAALRGNPTSTVQVRSLGIAWPTGDLFNELVEARAEVERLRRELDALQIAHNLLAESYARVQKRIPDPDDLRAVLDAADTGIGELYGIGDVGAFTGAVARVRATLEGVDRAA
jgi:uncharacterized small protein (DUF1192 family)